MSGYLTAHDVYKKCVPIRDFPSWMCSRYWNFWEGIMLLANIEPDEAIYDQLVSESNPDKLNSLPKDILESARIQGFKKALDFVFRESNNGPLGNNYHSLCFKTKHDTPRHFIELAQKRQLAIPHILVNSPETEDSGTLHYLNKKHPNYSPSLAAAIYAWQHVTAHPPKKGSVKKALISYLQVHAEEFELIKDGIHIKDRIEKIARIANWNPKGGAPKTP